VISIREDEEKCCFSNFTGSFFSHTCEGSLGVRGSNLTAQVVFYTYW